MQTVADESTLAWYLEVESPGYNSNDIDPFKNPGAAGHYTQVVWADTEELGCGMVYYKGAQYYETLIVCNYAKGGNFQGTFAFSLYSCVINRNLDRGCNVQDRSRLLCLPLRLHL